MPYKTNRDTSAQHKRLKVFFVPSIYNFCPNQVLEVKTCYCKNESLISLNPSKILREMFFPVLYGHISILWVILISVGTRVDEEPNIGVFKPFHIYMLRVNIMVRHKKISYT